MPQSLRRLALESLQRLLLKWPAPLPTAQAVPLQKEILKTFRAAHAARVNISQETHRAKASTHDQIDGEDQCRRPSPLQTQQFQVARGSQQPLRLNRNAECRRRHRARRQQIEDSTEAICSVDSEREVHTRISFKQCKDRASISERESRILQ